MNNNKDSVMLASSIPATSTAGSRMPVTINTYPVQPLMTGVIALCLILTGAAISLRIYTRIRTVKTRWEEYLAVLAWLLFIAHATVLILSGTAGAGRHIWELPSTNIKRVGYLSNIDVALYCPLIFTSKLLILRLFLRLFCPPPHNSPTFYTIHFLIWSNLIYYSLEIPIILFACNPRRRIWDPSITTGRCIDNHANFTFSAAWNTAVDIIMLILPLHSIWKLHLPNPKKLQICGVFAMGAFACVASFMRLKNSIDLLRAQDFTAAVGTMGLWSVAETTTIILSSAFPHLPQFFKLWTGRNMLEKSPPRSSFFTRISMIGGGGKGGLGSWRPWTRRQAMCSEKVDEDMEATTRDQSLRDEEQGGGGRARVVSVPIKLDLRLEKPMMQTKEEERGQTVTVAVEEKEGKI